jgi:hypothetical protein
MESKRVKVKCSIQMAVIIKENGKIIKYVVSEDSSILPINSHTQAIGKTVAFMVLAWFSTNKLRKFKPLITQIFQT